MIVSIWGKSKNTGKAEVIDRANSRRGAAYLAREYGIAFGSTWVVWAGRRTDEPTNPVYHSWGFVPTHRG